MRLIVVFLELVNQLEALVVILIIDGFPLESCAIDFRMTQLSMAQLISPFIIWGYSSLSYHTFSLLFGNPNTINDLGSFILYQVNMGTFVIINSLPLLPLRSFIHSHSFDDALVIICEYLKYLSPYPLFLLATKDPLVILF